LTFGGFVYIFLYASTLRNRSRRHPRSASTRIGFYRTHLLRRSYREGGTLKNETLGNLSHLPEPLIEIIRRSLQGETFVPLAQAFEITRSRPHGHVQAVATAMQRLGLTSLIATKPCREREQVLAMIASRIVAPHTKLATTRWCTPRRCR